MIDKLYIYNKFFKSSLKKVQYLKKEAASILELLNMDIINIIHNLNVMDDPKQQTINQKGQGNTQAISDSQPNHADKVSPPQSNMSAEQLQLMLKDKLKQNKTLQTKNTKLETKYVQLFRQQKILKQDHQVFVEFIKGQFQQMSEKTNGSYKVQQLKSVLAEREAKLSAKVKEVNQQMKKQKKQMETKFKEEIDQKIRNMEQVHSKNFDTNMKELESYKRNNKVLNDQMADLEKRLTAKNDEVSKISKQKLKLQHEINHYKIKQINKEINDSTKDKVQTHSVNRNQMLRLSQQVDSLMEKRDSLRAQLKQAKDQLKKYKTQIQEKDNKIAELTQFISDIENKYKKIEIQEPKLPVQVNSIPQKHQETELKLMTFDEEDDRGNEEFIHREYMKNAFLRYMKCLKEDDLVHAQILLNVIATILKFNAEEMEYVNFKKKAWWAIY